MLTGIYSIDSGKFILDGKEVAPKNQVEANDDGISIIVQELGTLSGLTVAENIFLGHEKQFVKYGIKNTNAMNKKTPLAAQSYLAAAVNAPVTVMDTAGEGGPWGMAVLAAYLLNKENMSLSEYLEKVIFKNATGTTVEPDALDVKGLEEYIEKYKAGIEVEKKAVEVL